MPSTKSYVKMNSRIEIKNSADTASIDIEGTIGMAEEWQFDDPCDRVATYGRFREQVAAIAALGCREIVVNIRSTGGDVNDALLIYEALRATGAQVTTRCYGYTASAATIVAQAASEGRRQIARSSLYLVHNSLCAAEGNAAELEAEADMLRQTDERLAALYAARSGRDEESFRTLMAENGGRGRWLSPEEALSAGLVDLIVDAPGAEDGARRRENSPDTGADSSVRRGLRSLARALLSGGGPEEECADEDRNVLHCGDIGDVGESGPALPPLPGERAAGEGDAEGRVAGERAVGERVAGECAAEGRAAAGEGETLAAAGAAASVTAVGVRDAAAVAGHSMIAFEQGQRRVQPTRVKPCEDPSPCERRNSPNSEAYDRDARSFAGRLS